MIEIRILSFVHPTGTEPYLAFLFVYFFNSPSRGDVVVLHDPEDPAEDFIKRVVGLPGETVQLKIDGSDRTFTARMSGPGRAVLAADQDSNEPAAMHDRTFSFTCVVMNIKFSAFGKPSVAQC